MIHINVVKPEPKIQADIKPIMARIQSVFQKPMLSLDPTKPPVIKVTEDLLEAIGTKDYPAEPLIVIPGRIIQAYAPEQGYIICILLEPKQPVNIVIHKVEDLSDYEAPTVIEK